MIRECRLLLQVELDYETRNLNISTSFVAETGESVLVEGQLPKAMQQAFGYAVQMYPMGLHARRIGEEELTGLRTFLQLLADAFGREGYLHYDTEACAFVPPADVVASTVH